MKLILGTILTDRQLSSALFQCTAVSFARQPFAGVPRFLCDAVKEREGKKEA